MRRVSGTAPLAERCLDAFAPQDKRTGSAELLVQVSGHVVLALDHFAHVKCIQQASMDLMLRGWPESVMACPWHEIAS